MESLSNWDVIVVDDQPHNLNVFSLVFDFHNVVHRTARSGIECLRLFENQIPNLLIIDIQMPGMDGIELLTRIRFLYREPYIPAIAVTAYTQTYQKQQILETGFDGFIAKPITVVTFLTDVKEILSH